jgi:hypothetical protein
MQGQNLPFDHWKSKVEWTVKKRGFIRCAKKIKTKNPCHFTLKSINVLVPSYKYMTNEATWTKLYYKNFMILLIHTLSTNRQS